MPVVMVHNRQALTDTNGIIYLFGSSYRYLNCQPLGQENGYSVCLLRLMQDSHVRRSNKLCGKTFQNKPCGNSNVQGIWSL